MTDPKPTAFLSRKAFWLLLPALIAAGLLRSWIATSKDGLQIDETWHAVAGVAYARTGDFRLNPEHPPLVKLWVGAMMPSDFKLPAFRTLDDKEGERVFVDDTFYVDNDPLRAHESVRRSMLAFHGLALLALGVALARVFGRDVAVAALGVLLIDPTVAAHLPVVLTDLPLALLGATAVLLAVAAFRSFRPLDLALAALALGLALAAKHSAIPVGFAVLAIGVALTFLDRPAAGGKLIARRLGGVAAVLLGAYLTLWATYGFRYLEGPSEAFAHATVPAAGHGTPHLFNRSLEDKIADLTSPRHRAIMDLTVATHFLPRAYLWGLADIIRVGVEGRQDILFVYGHRIEGDTPWYFFPAVLSAKVPLGITLLALLGCALILMRRVPRTYGIPLLALTAWAGIYLASVMSGNSGYAGVRHALPVFPVIALFAALALLYAVQAPRPAPRVAAGVALAAALLSALPVWRPWEYYNELVGGADGAWQYFADDGLENGQRGKELGEYYREHLAKSHEPVHDFYGLFEHELTAYGIEVSDPADDPVDSELLAGTVFVNTRLLSKRPRYDYEAFRAAKPVARFGNVLVMQGTFHIPWLRADRRLMQVYDALAPDSRDTARAEQLLSEVIEIYPEDFQSAFELANLRVERGAWELALAAYSHSLQYAPRENPLVPALEDQIAALKLDPAKVKPLRDPWLE